MIVSHQEEISTEDIKEFSKKIDDYRKELNKEGIILFITSIGVYSVDVMFMKVYAIVLIGMIFLYRVVYYMKKSDTTSFQKAYNILEAKIQSTQSGRKTFYQYHLDLIMENKMHGWTVLFRDGWIFILSFGFYSLTVTNLLNFWK